MSRYSRRFPKELERFKIPAEKADVAIKRLTPLIDMWPVEVDRDCLKQLALSAYTQGLVDGCQVCAERGNPVREERP